METATSLAKSKENTGREGKRNGAEPITGHVFSYITDNTDFFAAVWVNTGKKLHFRPGSEFNRREFILIVILENPA